MKIAVIMNLDWPLERYHRVFAGIKDYAEAHTDWTLVWDSFPEINLGKSKGTPYYGGMIGRIEDTAYAAAQEKNIPVVNTWFTNKITGLSSVFPNYERAGEIAAESMIKRGFTNFVSINYQSDKSSRPFELGIKSALKPYNFKLKTYGIPRGIEKNKKHWEKFHENFGRWKDQWKYPLAMFTSCSDNGPKLSTFCSENGMRIPEDVALVSSGNEITYCEGFTPTISSINIDYYKIGCEAARLLDCKIKGIEPEQNVIFLEPGGLVSRESTDSFAIQDEIVKKAMRFISDNFEKNIQINDVVSQLPISRRSLETRFSNAVGHTIHEEINRIRLQTVKRLLTQSDRSINELCLEAGFSNSQHMRRAFVKATGISPTEYRKNLTKK